RPAGQEIAKQRRVCLVEPVQCLRKVLLERVAQAVGKTGLVSDQPAALFDQVQQHAHLRTLGLERGEAIAVVQQQIQGELRIGGIIFGSAGFEASRYLANIEGLIGKRTKKSYFCSAYTSGPLDSSSATAMRPPNRWRIAHAHCSIRSTRCAKRSNSRCALSAACRQMSCFESAQSMPIKAVNSASGDSRCTSYSVTITDQGRAVLEFCEGNIGSRRDGRP